MYDEHYGLTGRPFQLTPDPRFWYETATHRKAMAYLGYGLSQGEGFIVITGDVGAGKTTLVGHLMDTIDAARLHVIKLVSTQIEADDLLRMVAGGLEIDSAGLTKAQLLVAIERGLHATARTGRRTLLIVDEAQALPVSSLEELRMLSNFQAGGHALLQIFLLGQPEFRERLHGSDRLEQLRQRVIAVHHLDPMEADEVEPYMRHRLSVVDWQDRPHFTPDAFAAFYAGSDGVPRRLNQLAGRVMLYGAIEQLDTIDGAVVDTVLADIAGDLPAHRSSQPMAFSAASIVVHEPAPVPPVEVAPVVAEAVIEDTVEPVAEPEIVVAVSPEPEPVAEIAPEPEPFVEPAAEAPRPLPIFHTPAPMQARPIRIQFDPTLPVMDTPEPAVVVESSKPEPEPTPETALVAEAAPAPEPATDFHARIAQLEARVEDQDAAMRRVLTLLVDWVEGDPRPNAAVLHEAAR